MATQIETSFKKKECFNILHFTVSRAIIKREVITAATTTVNNTRVILKSDCKI